MKYITNNDIVLKLNIDRRYIINYDKVRTIVFQFFTNNKDNAIEKDIVDVDKFNYITLHWNELMLMEEGNLKYTYSIYLLDGTVYDSTINTDYYICSNITNSVENNKVILSNYYTKEEVNDLLDNVSVGDVNLTNYYTKSEVNKIVDEIEIPSIDLSNYYTKSEVNAKIPKDYLTSIPSEYITESELNSKGYLTQHQSLSNYYTKSEVNTLIDNIDIPTGNSNVNLSNYYTKSEIDAKIPTDYIKEIPSEYVTETELNNVIGDIASVIDLINGEVI